MPSFLPAMVAKPDQIDYEFTGYLEESKQNSKQLNAQSVDEAQVVNIDE